MQVCAGSAFGGKRSLEMRVVLGHVTILCDVSDVKGDGSFGHFALSVACSSARFAESIKTMGFAEMRPAFVTDLDFSCRVFLGVNHRKRKRWVARQERSSSSASPNSTSLASRQPLILGFRQTYYD
jgi:hypothetical protein